ncbi:hypothetical protein ACSMXM_05665 [Pacificimonas sp. ICDLI1SI03]
MMTMAETMPAGEREWRNIAADRLLRISDLTAFGSRANRLMVRYQDDPDVQALFAQWEALFPMKVAA